MASKLSATRKPNPGNGVAGDHKSKSSKKSTPKQPVMVNLLYCVREPRAPEPEPTSNEPEEYETLQQD